MRRKIGLVLVGLGVLMMALAPLLRWYAYPRLAVVSGEVVEQVSAGQDVTILDRRALAEGEEQITRNTDVRSVRKIIPDVDAGTDDVAVWETSVTTVDLLGAGESAEDGVLSYYEERVAFDRHDAHGVDGYDQYYAQSADQADAEPVDHSGYYFKLPFDTERRDYEFWDSSLQQARPMVFDGEAELDGMAVYRFVQKIEPTPIAELEVPGALFGLPGAIVAEHVYANTRTIWVEPRTGAIVKGQEELDSHLAYGGERGPTIIEGTLAHTDEQVVANVEEYADSARTLELVRTTVPVFSAAGGAMLVIVGLLLARTSYTGRRRAVASPPVTNDNGVRRTAGRGVGDEQADPGGSGTASAEVAQGAEVREGSRGAELRGGARVAARLADSRSAEVRASAPGEESRETSPAMEATSRDRPPGRTRRVVAGTDDVDEFDEFDEFDEDGGSARNVPRY